MFNNIFSTKTYLNKDIMRQEIRNNRQKNCKMKNKTD